MRVVFTFLIITIQRLKAWRKMLKKERSIALKAFKEYGEHLGEAIKCILYLYAPDALILGGSISKAYPYFKDSMF